uniref:Serine/threonine-protein phosphatase n=1 Tax=Timema bartmani TaxID=61472 RepID=A0A7R9ESR7_9NEOP|nr:unnamed protein product [Timema bartmani]
MYPLEVHMFWCSPCLAADDVRVPFGGAHVLVISLCTCPGVLPVWLLTTLVYPLEVHMFWCSPCLAADDVHVPFGGAHVLVFSLFGCAAELVTSVNLAEWQIRQLCLVTREIFLEQPMLLELEAPVNIVGDIHGQYEDLLRHFDKLGYPPDANYLFLGDYVDRGKNSLETICLLLAYKIKYPNNFFLLRGNHECASINRVYGFYDECKRRYSVKLWKTFTDLFNCLPVSALIEGTIFCMHGGLSPQLGELNDIRSIPRPIDVPDSGLVCDLLWGDPAEVGITHTHTHTHTHTLTLTHTHTPNSCSEINNPLIYLSQLYSVECLDQKVGGRPYKTRLEIVDECVKKRNIKRFKNKRTCMTQSMDVSEAKGVYKEKEVWRMWLHEKISFIFILLK